MMFLKIHFPSGAVWIENIEVGDRRAHAQRNGIAAGDSSTSA